MPTLRRTQPPNLPGHSPTRGAAPRPVALTRCLGLGLGLGLSLISGGAHAGPVLWGYGVKPCRDFLTAAPGADAPTAVGGTEYLRYREWLAGFITGLNLATGSDVLGGAELDAALNRIRARCQAHPSDDFFNASNNLVRSLSRTKGTTAKGKPD